MREYIIGICSTYSVDQSVSRLRMVRKSSEIDSSVPSLGYLMPNSGLGRNETRGHIWFGSKSENEHAG